MLAKANKIQFCGAYARSVAHRSGRQPTRGDVNARLPFSRHILIVEFRDEVYASLRRVLEEEGLVVTRAETATEVAAKAAKIPCGLVLINESMPGECGWLISTKLRLSNSQSRVWVYTAKHLRYLHDWQELARAEHVISYGGDLLQLIRALRAQIRLQQQSRDNALSQSAVSPAVQQAFPLNLSGLPALAPRRAG